MSNFLGDVRLPTRHTYLLSTAELRAREGIEPLRSMYFREGDQSPLFFVLPNHDGAYKEAWDPKTETYVFEGHDSTTKRAGGKSAEQLLIYDEGRLSENGKFYRAANVRDARSSPLFVQVYEKISAGVWYDKGMFSLKDARRVGDEGHVKYLFDLAPADSDRIDRDEVYGAERMIPIAEKVRAWEEARGRCACGQETKLRFVSIPNAGTAFSLRCLVCRGERVGLLE